MCRILASPAQVLKLPMELGSLSDAAVTEWLKHPLPTAWMLGQGPGDTLRPPVRSRRPGWVGAASSNGSKDPSWLYESHSHCLLGPPAGLSVRLVLASTHQCGRL